MKYKNSIILWMAPFLILFSLICSHCGSGNCTLPDTFFDRPWLCDYYSPVTPSNPGGGGTTSFSFYKGGSGSEEIFDGTIEQFTWKQTSCRNISLTITQSDGTVVDTDLIFNANSELIYNYQKENVTCHR